MSLCLLLLDKYILLVNVGFRNFQNHTFWLLSIHAQIFITICHLYIHVLIIFYREKSTTGWCVVVTNYFLVLFQLFKAHHIIMLLEAEV